MGKRTAIIYLAVVAAGALAGGLLLDQIVTSEQIVRPDKPPWMLPPIVKHASAAVLLCVLLVAIVHTYVHKRIERKGVGGKTMELRIAGMTCSHCADSIRRSLLDCPRVETAEVDLAGGRAEVSGAGFNIDTLRKAIEELGYSLVDDPGGPSAHR